MSVHSRRKGTDHCFHLVILRGNSRELGIDNAKEAVLFIQLVLMYHLLCFYRVIDWTRCYVPRCTVDSDTLFLNKQILTTHVPICIVTVYLSLSRYYQFIYKRCINILNMNRRRCNI